MGRIRVGMVVTAIVGAGLIAGSFVDCAAPTQIVIEVRSDACDAKPKPLFRTGIAVGRQSEIEARDFSAFKEGCEDRAGGAVGTLTIYPSGANDDEVAIKVVGGVEVAPNLCGPPGYAGCIAHRRIMRFIPNTTQRAYVKLSLACLNRTCPEGTTCDNGVCKAQGDILPDGGTVDDAATTEAGISDGGMPFDAAVDACFGCVGGNCTNGPNAQCKVDCSNGCSGELCAPGLPCTIDCPNPGKCQDISCTTSEKCTVHCGGQNNNMVACNKVVCSARDCDIRCNDPSACSSAPGGGIFIDASRSGQLECDQAPGCTIAGCQAQTCQLTCFKGSPKDPRSCPNASTCSGGCTRWVSPVQPQ